ncbi:MAG: alpha/beta hydrolase [Thermoanaerobaculia bacterium]
MLKHFQTLVESFDSSALRGNPAGDPSEREVAVVLPRAAPPEARFPVLIVLAGFTSTGLMALNRRAWLPTFPEQLDRLRDRGAIGDMIAVLPDAFTIYGGSQYLNSTATGRYQDMLADDLVAWVDRRFPTHAAARHRAVAGKSSGGFGALSLAMDRPGLVSAVACHSGDMYFDYCYLNDFPRLLAQLDRHGGLEKFIDSFLAAPKKPSEQILAMSIVAMTAAYSPNPEKPRRLDLPFDPRTGEVLPEVWQRWLERDPVRRVEAAAGALRSLRLLYLDCGSRDQFQLHLGLRILRQRLTRLGIPHQAEEFDDDHTDTGYRWEVSLPKLWEAIR